MKKILVFAMALMPLINNSIFAYSFNHEALLPIEVTMNLEGISKAISAGDAAALSMYFDQNVEISILDQEDVYDKATATQTLKNFFAKNKPKAYSQVHKGASQNKDSQYCIGNLQTATGNFRVYIYLKINGAQVLIQEMRFDKE